MKTRKIFFCKLCIILIAVFMAFPVSLTAYASAVNPGMSWGNIIGGGFGGGGIPIYFNERDRQEIKNFATVSDDKDYISSSAILKRRIESKPNRDTDYNNMDYVIYMVDRLESLAEDYTGRDKQRTKNCVLGYIRGINANYAGTEEKNKTSEYEISNVVGGAWAAFCGNIDKGFINYVKAHENGQGITFPEFFASFLRNGGDYNDYLYGTVDNYFLNKHHRLPDPLGTGQFIDLIHMFASMDGIYKKTENNIAVCTVVLGTASIHRDIVSWSGDLQQLIKSLFKKSILNESYNSADGFIDFNEYTGGKNFSSDDLLADLDAFNITKLFIDSDKNSIKHSLLGYYNEIKNDKSTLGNRFCEAIYTITIDLEGDKQNSVIENFRKEVCNAVNVGYQSGNYWEESIHSGYTVKIMGDNSEYETRKICAKLFCDYIEALSGRSD
ncbi:MAG: hypothetical protein NC131_19700 [Roseburia sp.]|nr:hypothetical protein [Roseburia sp.]